MEFIISHLDFKFYSMQQFLRRVGSILLFSNKKDIKCWELLWYLLIILIAWSRYPLCTVGTFNLIIFKIFFIWLFSYSSPDQSYLNESFHRCKIN